MATAEELKNKGNEYFKSGKYALAVEQYTLSLDKTGPLAPVLCNRAFAHLKSESFGAAIVDAEAAIEADPDFVKGYYRRASCKMALGKAEEALKDFKRVTVLEPKDRGAAQKYNACLKQVQQARFLEAVATPDEPPMSTQLNVESIDVPSTYTGPRIADDGVITPEFVTELMHWYKNQNSLHRKYAIMIILQAIEILKKLPTCNPVTIPEGEHLTVCGDVHGQYYDLLKIFELGGLPSESNPYLFNGDFVDRGSFSVECIMLLLAWKCCLPGHMHMHRGNHEGRNLNTVYGFQGEVKAKYDDKVFELFQELFAALPLCSTINNKVFVVHGGLFSQDGVTIAKLNQLNRFAGIPDSGLMSELLWSDPSPVPQKGRTPNKRGVAVAFGHDVTEDFLKTNGLELVIRSHEVKENGYEIDHYGKLITVFSAPNYCDQVGNKAAFIRMGADCKPEFTTFTHSPHPDVPPMKYSMMTGLM
eukprot:NODE_854_length_1593_cov_117.547067_g844_i0.p1 GENE.NODE_854_length_1593_cov_117.547067_g844_i0~~NODE_854_length_1593_cov_117.547067_g844_i0.p1  ORF type:complete len:474 (-),score=95.34 NODE_854_length_1593_cov_117.547067_g844_i0:94-1515(-)